MKTIILTFLLLALTFSGCIRDASVDSNVEPEDTLQDHDDGYVQYEPEVYGFSYEIHNGSQPTIFLHTPAHNVTATIVGVDYAFDDHNLTVNLPGTDPGGYSVQATITYEEVTDPRYDEEPAPESIAIDYAVNGFRPAWFDEPPTNEQWIRPGVQIPGCTASFLMHQNYERFFLSTAAHCVSINTDDEDYCGDMKPYPLGKERVIRAFDGPSDLFPSERTAIVTLAYNGWGSITPVRDEYEFCGAHDMALLEIQPQDWHLMHPTGYGIIGEVTGVADCSAWGGETMDPAMIPIKAYGRSGYRQFAYVNQNDEGDVMNNREGFFLHPVFNGMKCLVHTGIPQIFGDSGSPLSSMDGKAMGIAATLNTAPPSTNNYVNVPVNLDIMEELVGWAPEVVLSA